MTAHVDENYDPFEAFDRAMGAETVRNRYPAFAMLRRKAAVHTITLPMPVHVIAGMIGRPEEDIEQFHGKAVAMTNVGSDWDRGLQASRWLRDYLAGILEQRRHAPGPDLIAVLAGAELDGQRLTD